MCQRYNYEFKEIEKIIDVQPMGLLMLQFSNFKEIILPEPSRLLAILDNAMPM